ncbi:MULTISPECIES: FAD-dependent oxidoreductase [Halolamina]|uniref:Pyridine nucleotide-disulphide oxidoreductase n=1 Tax=Halolamina pelagica TaxID=699431 RepID=A0A1I5NFN5_9EURY|nr:MULTISPECIES: FAD-dependent oxidoreductase [Halolamina]NHX36293.1 NAD(P)/FAD-dependent oxidoreductase [Halolamina sp. R1-12]SFP20655.1 Pyridine nucleotide-disulphide oxidoreductase [Halolamina pelagica]
MANQSGEEAFDHDVVVVGGGPAGCAAGVFTARYGLETEIFDRGRSSIQQCAHLENYLGFPGGIDVATFGDLIHDQAESAGCAIVPDLVESVERADDDGFLVEPQTGEPVTARRVIAATRYGGEYLRGLDDEDAMFETHEYDGETEEYFDKQYAESDGTTPVDGLFIASPYAETSPQAIMAAGHGARVGVAVVEAVRREQGYPDSVADYYDWVRPESERTGEWSDRDRWREFFENRFPDDHELSPNRVAEIREREIDRRFDMYISEEEAERRATAGQRRLLDHIDDDLVVEAAREIEAEREESAATDD